MPNVPALFAAAGAAALLFLAAPAHAQMSDASIEAYNRHADTVNADKAEMQRELTLMRAAPDAAEGCRHIDRIRELGFDALASLNLMKQLASSSGDQSAYTSAQATFEELETQLAKVRLLKDQRCG
ncbi:hypothetical protein ACFQ1E_03835 [Sphingomonas canadensis]|uniref:Uncharacterized protein n=1 Tax=Sphingomonas canadensis TaxID=1219257 RepID=A0ABW3H2S0_9SPHN|nr:hypothetical protein [Sphingomonas canadensis]MCW3834626.1 hypothetical protein [Sphingomonas canadensis]